MKVMDLLHARVTVGRDNTLLTLPPAKLGHALGVSVKNPQLIQDLFKVARGNPQVIKCTFDGALEAKASFKRGERKFTAKIEGDIMIDNDGDTVSLWFLSKEPGDHFIIGRKEIQYTLTEETRPLGPRPVKDNSARKRKKPVRQYSEERPVRIRVSRRGKRTVQFTAEGVEWDENYQEDLDDEEFAALAEDLRERQEAEEAYRVIAANNAEDAL
jgi:hypothetical protein